jgi:carbon-monoxide dehydrogenase small subunit
MDGRSVRSCLLFAVQAEGHELTTVEGLADPDGNLSPAQEAFSANHALQCGFCTPGFLMAVTEYLEEGAPAVEDEEALRARLSGNICRCTGYQNIVTAVRAAAEQVRGGREA